MPSISRTAPDASAARTRTRAGRTTLSETSGTERQPSSSFCSPEVSSKTGLTRTMTPPGSAPTERSMIATRLLTPIWGAASPMPGAAWQVSTMSREQAGEVRGERVDLRVLGEQARVSVADDVADHSGRARSASPRGARGVSSAPSKLSPGWDRPPTVSSASRRFISPLFRAHSSHAGKPSRVARGSLLLGAGGETEMNTNAASAGLGGRDRLLLAAAASAAGGRPRGAATRTSAIMTRRGHGRFRAGTAGRGPPQHADLGGRRDLRVAGAAAPRSGWPTATCSSRGRRHPRRFRLALRPAGRGRRVLGHRADRGLGAS